MPRRSTLVAGAALAAGAVALSRTLTSVLTERGGRPSAAALARMKRSARFRDGRFHNTSAAPAVVEPRQDAALRRMWANRASHRPSVAVPLVEPEAPAADGLHVTWYGHASALVELDGVRILLDPVWSKRCSPSQLVGPRRLHDVPVPLADLGRVDAVVISHDHYDHLDRATVTALAAQTEAMFLVPLGVGAHLELWGVPEARVIECDWDDALQVGGVTITCVESQHFSGRWLNRWDTTLWASWVIAGRSGRVFFSGDTGYFETYPDLARAYGPFDVALMAVGAYDPSWPHIHLDPEQAVRATVDLGSPLLLPIHWCTFTLAPHPWAEPVERTLAAAADAGVRVQVPRPGARIDVSDPGPVEPWWRPTDLVEPPAPGLLRRRSSRRPARTPPR